MPLPSLQLGEPPFDDPVAAAHLWLKYEAAAHGKPSQETSTMFFRMVKSLPEVLDEIDRLRASA